jgi:S1-C subfamily serine protease
MARSRAVEGVEVRAGRTTDQVKIVLEGKPEASDREPRGAGSVAVTLGERGRSVLVLMVPAGSEAEAAGIEPGDVLTSVNGQAVSSIEAARRGLTGPLSEDVVLELQRDDGEPGSASESWTLRVRRERVRR